MKKEDLVRSSLYKWNKNVQKSRCEENADIINDFCRQIRQLTLAKNQKKWQHLSHRLLPHQINFVFKLGKINLILDKVHKRRFMAKLDQAAFKSFMNDLFISLLSKYDDNAKMELLRKKLNHWRNQVRRMSDYKYGMASIIQRKWREFHENEILKRNTRLTSLLQRFVERILNYSDAILPAALHKWNKIAHSMKYKQSATTIQDFCLDIKKLLRKLKKDLIYSTQFHLDYLGLMINLSKIINN